MISRYSALSLTPRSPATCLYCSEPAVSKEHAIPRAIGGRIRARILCGAHNNTLSPVDKALAEHYAPLTFGANVERQKKSAGTTLTFTDADGRRVTVSPDGRSSFALHSVEKNDAGVVQRASGAIESLRAIAEGHPDPNGFRIFEVIGPGAVIPIEVGIARETMPGYLKIALHFAAGFVADPPPATIAALRPGIFGEHAVRAKIDLPFREPYFDPNGPIRHEVTIYPAGTEAIATVMLYSSFCVAFVLPQFGVDRAVRYVQNVDGSAPELFEVEPILIPRLPLSEREIDAFRAIAGANVNRIFAERHRREINEICEQAARNAMGHVYVHGMGVFLEYFEADLRRVPLHQNLVEELVRQARAHLAAGRIPFDPTPMLIRSA